MGESSTPLFFQQLEVLKIHRFSSFLLKPPGERLAENVFKKFLGKIQPDAGRERTFEYLLVRPFAGNDVEHRLHK